MTQEAFAPTHTIPPTGLPSWDEPDPSQPPNGRLDPGLVVEVIAEQGEWARVRCSNDWQTWVNHAALVVGAVPTVVAPPTPAPITAQAPLTAPMSGYFAPTNQIPAGGLEARARPDAADPVVAWVNEGLPVQVVGQGNGWCNVRFDNGWEAWVDGSRLVPWGTPVGGPARAPGSANPLALWLPIGGAVVVLLGSVLAWFSVIESISAWDLPIASLLDKTSTSTAPDCGWLLLVVVVVVIPLATRAPLPRAVLGVIGAVPIVVTLLALRLYLSFPSPRPDLGAGLLLTLLGGAAIAATAALPPNR